MNSTILKVYEKFPPENRYRIKETGQHCTICAYSMDGTLTVTVDGHDLRALDAVNRLIPIDVFGIKPKSLELI